MLENINWDELPRPLDDGAADHLLSKTIPSIKLAATTGLSIDLGAQKGLLVIYIYPMTGRPDRPLPEGWDMIPGARGCTPQSCVFRDHFGELQDLGVDHLFGLSTQSTAYQREAADRLHLPFPLLSDEFYRFSAELSLPTFEVERNTLLKRLTMIVENGNIIFVRYPVFPPDGDAEKVIEWLRSRKK